MSMDDLTDLERELLRRSDALHVVPYEDTPLQGKSESLSRAQPQQGSDDPDEPPLSDDPEHLDCSECKKMPSQTPFGCCTRRRSSQVMVLARTLADNPSKIRSWHVEIRPQRSFNSDRNVCLCAGTPEVLGRDMARGGHVTQISQSTRLYGGVGVRLTDAIL
ncbi:hypothetical protein MRX96_001264 [Rhipicephalus microplus]